MRKETLTSFLVCIAHCCHTEPKQCLASSAIKNKKSHFHHTILLTAFVHFFPTFVALIHKTQKQMLMRMVCAKLESHVTNCVITLKFDKTN